MSRQRMLSRSDVEVIPNQVRYHIERALQKIQARKYRMEILLAIEFSMLISQREEYSH